MFPYRFSFGSRLAVMTCVILCIVWFATKYFESERIRLIRREVWTVHFVAKSLARRVADGGLELASQSGKVLCDDVPVPCTFTQSDFVWDFPRKAESDVRLALEETHSVLFFAHSREVTSDGERIFIIQSPLYGVILHDHDVDWDTHTIDRQMIPGPL